MTQSLLDHILQKQAEMEVVPPNETISNWASRLICLMYPEMATCKYYSADQLEQLFLELKRELLVMLQATKSCHKHNLNEITDLFFKHIPEIYSLLNTDVEAILNGDPAAKTEFEVIRAYPGFYALCFYRIAHELHNLNVPLLPRILTEYAHSKTGIDIHPAAIINQHCHIDHGTGLVIGETAIIGKHVKIYQGVTLGALSVDKSMANVKRHPTIGDRVILYSNATVLGGETIIGSDSVIGGNVWLTESVPPGSLVYHTSQTTIEKGKFKIYV